MADVDDDRDGEDENGAENVRRIVNGLTEIIEADVDEAMGDVPFEHAAPAVYAIALKLAASNFAMMHAHAMPKNIVRLTRTALRAGFREAVATVGVTTQTRHLHEQALALGDAFADDVADAVKTLVGGNRE